jgi:hypothetical protein
MSERARFDGAEGGGAGFVMLPVISDSSLASRSNFEDMPLGASDAKLQAIAASHSANASSSSSGPSVTDAAIVGDLTTHALSRGAGNGLDEASGTATKNTKAPQESPAIVMAE